MNTATAPQPPAPPTVEVEPGRIAITKDGGTVDSIPREQLADAQAQQYRPATAQEVYVAKTGTVGQAVAAADAFARGATFGLSDKAQIELGRAVGGDAAAEDIRQKTRILQQAHPTTATVGEVGGSLAGMFLVPGGASTAPIKAEGPLARAGVRALRAAPRLAAEGAALSAGHQFSEDTLGNHDYVAQKYLAAAGKGAIINVLLGGALHGAGGAVADKFGSMLARAEEGAAAGGGRSLGARIASFAERQAFKGTGAKLKDIQKLGASAEAQEARMQGIGRRLLDEGITTPGASLKDQASRLTAKVAEAGEELGVIRKSLEKASARPSVETLVSKVENELLAPLLDKPFSQAEAAAVKPYLAEIVERTKGKAVFDSFEELHKIRRALDDKLKSKAWDVVPGTQSPATKEMMKLRGILEDVYEEGAERAAKELGEDIFTKYVAGKARFADLKTAEKIAVKEVARAGANRAISLTDTIAAAAAIPAALAGHPMALLAPVGNKLARTYGNQTAAYALDRVSRLQMLQRAAEATDTKMSSAVDSFFTKKGSPGRRAERVTPETARALRAAVSDPSVMTDRVSQAVARTGLAEDAPNVSRAMVAALARAGTYLQNRLPPEPAPKGLAFGPTTPRPMGLRAQAEVNNAVRALDVDSILEDVANNRMDRQQMEAIRIINPELHEQLVSKFENYVIDNRPQVSRQQQVALSIITGKPLSAIMQPKMIRGFQQVYASAPVSDPTQAGMDQPRPMGSGGSAGPSRKAATMASAMDKMEAQDGP